MPPAADLPAAAPVTVATLRPGDAIDTVLACSRKDRLTSKSGAPYLALELRDRTGAIAARVFRDADKLAGGFDRGDLVRVRGTVERFRENLQLDVLSVARAPADAAPAPETFLPTTFRDMEELDGFLEHHWREVHDPGYRGLLDVLLGDDALRGALRRAPCTVGGHHAYLGGLLEHTVAVSTLAAESCLLHVRLNSDLLLCAAIVHDIGKVREFAYGAEIEQTEEGRLLGHVELGLRIIFSAAARVEAFDEPRRLQLAHCVLTHHGPDGAGRGGRFGSPEALALHRINLLDATVKGALEHGL